MSQCKRHCLLRPDAAAEEGMSMSNCWDSGENGEVIKMESSCTMTAVPSPRKSGISTAGSRTAMIGHATGSPRDSNSPGKPCAMTSVSGRTEGAGAPLCASRPCRTHCGASCCGNDRAPRPRPALHVWKGTQESPLLTSNIGCARQTTASMRATLNPSGSDACSGPSPGARTKEAIQRSPSLGAWARSNQTGSVWAGSAEVMVHTTCPLHGPQECSKLACAPSCSPALAPRGRQRLSNMGRGCWGP